MALIDFFEKGPCQVSASFAETGTAGVFINAPVTETFWGQTEDKAETSGD
ncbi:MAG: hypothetical protein SGJ27_27020 [Candidatus Melainabacteria bacterium]|nr:hypothetical protein [Candidatus Melainabacteria bacterium]